MKNCDYEIAYYQDGNRKTFTVPKLLVDENLTPEELNKDLKRQIKDVMTNALSDPAHQLYETVAELTKPQNIFQPIEITQLPPALTNSPVGIQAETNKKKHDGNVKLSDLKAHLEVATHPYAGLMKNLLEGEDLNLPAIHFQAEKYNPTGNPDDDIDSAFGVFIMGAPGSVDTIKVYTGKNDGDLDVLNDDHEVAKVLAHEMVHYKVNRKLDEWARKDRVGFLDALMPIFDSIHARKHAEDADSKHFTDVYNSIIEGKKKAKFGTNEEIAAYGMKEIFAYALTDKAFANKLNQIPFQGERNTGSVLTRIFKWVKDLLGLKVKIGSTLREVLNQYDNLQLITPNVSAVEKTPEPRIAQFNPKSYSDLQDYIARISGVEGEEQSVEEAERALSNIKRDWDNLQILDTVDIKFKGDDNTYFAQKVAEEDGGYRLEIYDSNNQIIDKLIYRFKDLENGNIEEIRFNGAYFARVIDPAIYQQVTELPAFTPEQVMTANNKIWRNFFEATSKNATLGGSNYARYINNYGEPVKTLGPSETLAGNDASLFRLGQNDIIRYNMMKKDASGNWVQDLEKTGYSPIIYNYYNKQVGQTFFVVATQSGPRHVSKENIQGYRKFYGNIRYTAKQIPAAVKRSIMENKKNVASYFKGKNVDEKQFTKEILYKDGAKFNVFAHNEGKSFFLPRRESLLFFRDAGPNDLVQVVKYNEDPKAKKEYEYFTVLRPLGDALETLDKDNKIRIVEKRLINGMLILEENHGNVVKNFKSEFGDNNNKAVIANFANIKKTATINFENKMKLRDILKKGETVPANLTYLLFQNKQEIFNEDGDFVKTNSFTSVKELYHTELFTGDENVDYKFKKVASVNRGDIVMIESNDPAFPYGTAVVLDFDEVTGRPVVGHQIKSNKPKVTMLPGGKISHSMPSAWYKIETVPVEKILGIGHNLVDNEELGLRANKEITRKIDNAREDFIKSKSYQTFETLAAAEALKKSKNLLNYEVATQYVYPDEKISFTPPDKGVKSTKRYVLKHTKTNNLRSDYNPYNYLSKDAIAKSDTDELWNDLQVGDMMTRQYSTDNGNRYYEGIVVVKNTNSIVLEKSFLNRADQKITRSTVEIYKKKGQKTGLDSITNIGFSFKGRAKNGAKSLVDKHTTMAVKGNSVATTQVDNEAPFSKDFTSTDKKSFVKSAKASKQLLTGLASKLEGMYGIKMNLLSTEEIAEQFDLDPNATLLYSEQRAFVYGNQVFLNTDKASLAEPIHELGHIIMQGLKSSNNSLYQTIISKFAAHPQFDNIAKHYPNLDQNRQAEEVFVTTLGEMFNGRIGNELTKKWESDNRSFLGDVYNSIKNFLAELFGINNRSFFELGNYEIMNMSFEEIQNHFGKSMLTGEFIPAVEVNNIKQETLEDGTYLRAADGRKSSLYTKLLSLGFSEAEASKHWLKTKSEAFNNEAAKSYFVKAEDGEPALFLPTLEKFIYQPVSTIADNTKLVYLKGNIEKVGDSYRVISPSQVQSIHSVGSTEIEKDAVDSVTKFASRLGIQMEGTENEMYRNVPKLKELFPDLEFEVVENFGDYTINFYKAPSQDVQELKKLLMNNKNLQIKC